VASRENARGPQILATTAATRGPSWPPWNASLKLQRADRAFLPRLVAENG